MLRSNLQKSHLKQLCLLHRSHIITVSITRFGPPYKRQTRYILVLYNCIFICYNIIRFGAWLSLVERLNGVQEAASSILVAPIHKERESIDKSTDSLFYFKIKASRLKYVSEFRMHTHLREAYSFSLFYASLAFFMPELRRLLPVLLQ